MRCAVVGFILGDFFQSLIGSPCSLGNFELAKLRNGVSSQISAPLSQLFSICFASV
jgi:hypothetical protein